MGLDKVKHNLHIGSSGVGPADSHSSNDARETNAREESVPRDGGGNKARGLRGHSNGQDKHARVQDVLHEGKQKIQRLLERTGDARTNRSRIGRGEEHTPPGQAKRYRDGGGQDSRDTNRPEVRDTRQARVPSDGDGEHGRSHRSFNFDNHEHGRSHETHGRRDEDHGRSHESRSQGNDGRGDRVQRRLVAVVGGNEFDRRAYRLVIVATGAGAKGPDRRACGRIRVHRSRRSPRRPPPPPRAAGPTTPTATARSTRTGAARSTSPTTRTAT